MTTLIGACHCGQVKWELTALLESATSCNCTVCRRYGALWAYGYLNHDVRVQGESRSYSRGESIDFHFCPRCGCVTHYLGTKLNQEGKKRAVVNLRMTVHPELLEKVPIDRFDGLVEFKELPRDGRCVKDHWF